MSMFSLTAVDEAHLKNAPLAKVVMQVQYSRTPQLVKDDSEAALAELLGRYPVRRCQVTAGNLPSVVINGQEIAPPAGISPGVAIAFSDPKGEWQATVSETAAALETTAYDSRDDFCERATEMLEALASVAIPPVVDRVGIRYIDRLTGGSLASVPSFIIPQLRTLAGSLESPLQLRYSITESQIEIGSAEFMLVRSGFLPPGATFDPALPSVTEHSWVLDMDVFTAEATFEFDPVDLSKRLRRYAEAAYAFFRFATTDQFQDAHSGTASTDNAGSL